jgi:uncharacterized protein YaiI (UPF0178 family)
MKILVDADALPAAARDILLRAAQRVKIKAVFIANKVLRLPDSDFIGFELAEAGPDEADDRIVALAESGDLVITADIPLAARIVECGAIAIDPRGVIFDENNIKERLFVRDFMADLRNSGAITGGPPAYGIKESRRFAAVLDHWLARLKR